MMMMIHSRRGHRDEDWFWERKILFPSKSNLSLHHKTLKELVWRSSLNPCCKYDEYNEVMWWGINDYDYDH